MKNNVHNLSELNKIANELIAYAHKVHRKNCLLWKTDVRMLEVYDTDLIDTIRIAKMIRKGKLAKAAQDVTPSQLIPTTIYNWILDNG